MTESPHAVAVHRVLNRDVEIGALSSLQGALRFELTEASLAQTVIAFDANAILRLSGHRRGDDIVDYLRSGFPGRVILPGQVIQEFWNNQFQAVLSVAATMEKKLKELGELVATFDARFDSYRSEFMALIDRFKDDFGYVFDENTVTRTRAFIDLLEQKSLVPFIPRAPLQSTAQGRKRSKTPPGFKDDLDGDFYVWADLLYGLSLLKADGYQPTRVVLVTLDKKIDWSRDGVPHPILSAEMSAICGGQFETLTIDQLARRLLDQS